MLAPLLVDITLVAYYSNRDGSVDPEALHIWATLLAFAVAGFWLGRMDLNRVLSPLQVLIAGRLDISRARALLVPHSLDGLGVVTSRLLDRIAEEEALRRDVNLLTERLVQATNLTGMDDPAIAVEASASGAAAFLSKPVDAARLSVVLNAVIQEWSAGGPRRTNS